MADPIVTPMLIGAGVGTLGSLASGGSPLKGAATGATLGGLGAGASQFLPAAFGATPAAATAAQGAGAANAMLTPTLAPIGMANSFNMATNAALPAVAGSSAVNTAPLISSAMPNAGGLVATNSPNIANTMPNPMDYLSPNNLMSAAQLMGGEVERMPVAPAGGVSRGQAPQGDAIAGLLSTVRIPERQKRMNLFA